MRTLEMSYRRAPHFDKVWAELVEPIFSFETDLLSDLCVDSMTRIARR